MLNAQQRATNILKQFGVAALYALLLYAGELFFEGGNIVRHFEPASGFALAVLLLGGKRYAWGVFFGAALIHAITCDSLWEAVIVASGDVLQAFFGAWLLTRSGFDLRLQSLHGYLRLILLGGIISVAFGALAVSAILQFSGLPIHEHYFYGLRNWWMSDTLGVILITPLILTWWQTEGNWHKTGRMIEALLLLALIILMGQIVFFDWLRNSIVHAPKAYWMFIPITWVAIRFGTREATTTMVVVAVMGLFGAVHGTGYFAYDVAQNHLFNYWIFMVTLSVVGMALATRITEHKKYEEEIHNLAFYDALTKLPNRRLFLDRFRVALTASGRLNKFGAVLFIDLDRFKLLNDTLGHDYGDLLLIEVAARIKSCVREMDTVARLGGDEFVVLIEGVSDDQEEAAHKVGLVAEKIRESLAHPYHLNGHEHQSSPSIGVSLYHDNEETVDELLQHADMAMYQAKEAGRNAVRFFDPVMQDNVATRAALVNDLRGAIERRQLHLHYQLQVDNDNRPIGAEALLRWVHPQRGMVMPEQFLPIAEESTLILEIGDWVLETACRQLALWGENEKMRDLVLTANISAKQFAMPDFVDRVASVLRMHRINPARLKLELTESMALDNLHGAIEKMRALKALGVCLSMDDFGTRYSSLSNLKQLPLDQIKLGRSFVRDVASDGNVALLVQSIIDMSSKYRITVIAEGVENRAQLASLKDRDCVAYQGFLFSKAVPVEEFEKLLGL